MLDLIIKGGRVVTPQGVDVKDIGIQGDKIAFVALPETLEVEAQRTIDAAGRIVLPGGIEPHTHIGIPVPEIWAGRSEVITQPPEAASRAAAFGGVTTFIDFAGNLGVSGVGRGLSQLPSGAVGVSKARFRPAIPTPITPFTRSCAGEVPPKTIGEIGEAIQAGVASFKIFTTFALRVPYGHLWAIFQEVAKNGGIMAVHAEEDDIVNYMTEKLKREGNDQGYNLHLVHNNISEDIALS